MTNIIVLSIYLLELFNYFIAYKLLFKEQLKNFTIPIGGGIIVELLFLASQRSGSNSSLLLGLYILPVFVLVVIQFCSKSFSISKIIMVFFIETCMSEVFAKGLDLVFSMNDIQSSTLVKNLIVYTFLSLLWFLMLVQNRRLTTGAKAKLHDITEKAVFVIVILIAWAMLFSVGGLSLLNEQITDPMIKPIVTLLIFLSYAGVGLLGFLSYYMYRTNATKQAMIRDVINLKRMQKEYYDTLLEREADTRKYRHDMANHLICLERFLKDNNHEAGLNYLDKMKEHASEIQKKSYSIGNEILEILTAHYVSQLDDTVTVKVSGHVDVEVDELKLCTIYANLLQNAVEELSRCEKDKSLEITFKQGRDFFQIGIWNTLSEAGAKVLSLEELGTSKADKKNHGIGLRNVRETVNELGGTLTLNNEGDYFHASVILNAQASRLTG
jgi:signal transduction histidine kinase